MNYLGLAETLLIAEAVTGLDALVLARTSRLELLDSALQAPLAGFVGSELRPLVKDVLSVGQLSMGRGAITLFTDDILFRSFWETGKLMLCNAVFFSAD